MSGVHPLITVKDVNFIKGEKTGTCSIFIMHFFKIWIELKKILEIDNSIIFRENEYVNPIIFGLFSPELWATVKTIFCKKNDKVKHYFLDILSAFKRSNIKLTTKETKLMFVQN